MAGSPSSTSNACGTMGNNLVKEGGRPFAMHRGRPIHSTIEGTGPLVILQHGILLSAESWKQSGIVDALTDDYRVACIDSLGHGLSDKPSDRTLYGQAQRSGDIVAVLDAIGDERAHLIGH